MNTQRNILLLIPNLGAGGAQQVFRDQVAFYSLHYNVTACVFNLDNLLDEDRALPLRSLDVPGGTNTISKMWRFWQRIRRLRDIRNELQTHTVISHLEGADYINLLSGGAGKSVCWIHGTKTADRNIRGILGWVRKELLIPILYRRSSTIVTVSHGIKDELVRSFGIKPGIIRTIYNRIDTNAIARGLALRCDELDRLSGDHMLLVTHCRLAKEKNLGTMLEIFRAVVADVSRVKLVIIGDGELRDQLLDMGAAMGLRIYSPWRKQAWSDNYDVYFMGYQQNPYRMLRYCTIYLMTSIWEGFPLSLCEALACGLPIVASDCRTGPREILQSVHPGAEPDFGVLLPVPDRSNLSALWSTEINRLLRNAAARGQMAARAAHRARYFDTEETATQWLAVI